MLSLNERPWPWKADERYTNVSGSSRFHQRHVCFLRCGSTSEWWCGFVVVDGTERQTIAEDTQDIRHSAHLMTT